MSDLRPPATGTEAYLEAILEELRVLRQFFEDGQPVRAQFDEAHDAEAPAVRPATSQVKRTRTRTRGAAT
jgi:hypothetical protein